MIDQPTLAHPYKNQRVDGWLMSEKLDGVRAIWTGNKLISRANNEFIAPQWFLSHLPENIMLDGELYIDRDNFQQTVGIVRHKIPTDGWERITYQVFDAPSHDGIFVDRLAFAANFANERIIAVEHAVCENTQHMHSFHKQVIQLGGEGIMLRDPDMKYVQGRTNKLLKVKIKDHAEAEVIGYKPGTGRLSGLVGALICRNDSHTFQVGSGLCDKTRSEPPCIGSRITYGYNGVTESGTPRFPTFVAVRDYE